jgi:hypothetical protein
MTKNVNVGDASIAAMTVRLGSGVHAAWFLVWPELILTRYFFATGLDAAGLQSQSNLTSHQSKDSEKLSFFQQFELWRTPFFFFCTKKARKRKGLTRFL